MDLIAKIIAVPFFILTIIMAIATLFARANWNGWTVPYFSLKSLVIRMIAAFCTLIFFVIAVKLWG